MRKFELSKIFSGVLLASGTGSRLVCDLNANSKEIPKQFLPLCENKSILEISLDKICVFADFVVVTLPLGFYDENTNKKLGEIAASHDTRLKLIEGGKTRSHSVYLGCQEINTEYLFIHDSARPLVAKEDIEKLLRKTIECGACALGKPCVDTLKSVSSSEIPRTSSAFIQATLDRNYIWTVETPQAFKTELFKSSLERHKNELQTNIFTDDLSLLEADNIKTVLVKSESVNFKITTMEDYRLARLVNNT